MKWKAKACLLFLFLVSTACLWGETVPKELQGVWEASGENDGHGWFIKYTIDGYGYKMEGYPPITASGQIQLIERKGARYQLGLSKVVFHGESSENKEMWVEIKKDGKILQWEGHQLQKTTSSKK